MNEPHDLLVIRKHDDDSIEVRFDASGENDMIAFCTCLYQILCEHPVVPHMLQAIGEIMASDDEAYELLKQSKVELPDFNELLKK